MEELIPKKFEDLWIPNSIKNELTTWMDDRINDNNKNILLLEGFSGLGKTTICELLCKKYGFQTLTFGGHDIKHDKFIRTEFYKSLVSKNIHEVMSQGRFRTVVILDDLDQLVKTTQLKDIIDYVKKAFKIENDKNADDMLKRKHSIKNIFICIFNKFINKKLLELKKYSTFISLCDLTIPFTYFKKWYYPILTNLKKTDKIKLTVTNDILKDFYDKSKNDLNQFMNIVSVKSNDKIYNFNTEINKNNFGECFVKDVDFQLYDGTRYVLTDNTISNEILMNITMSDELLFPLMIYDHYFYEIFNQMKLFNIEKRNIYNRISNISELFVISNKFHQLIFHEQSNNAHHYYGYFSFVYPRYILLQNNKHEFTKKPIKFEYPKMRTKVSSVQNSVKYLQKMQLTLYDWSFKDFYYFTEFMLKNSDDKDDENLEEDKQNISLMLKKYNMKFEHFNTLKNCNKYLTDKDRKKLFDYWIQLIKEIKLDIFIDNLNAIVSNDALVRLSNNFNISKKTITQYFVSKKDYIINKYDKIMYDKTIVLCKNIGTKK